VNAPLPRQAAVEWSQRNGAGELGDLAWVDARVRSPAEPFSTDGATFHHLPYGRFLPRALADEIADGQEAGDATLLEAVLLLFARPEWIVQARRLLWTPISPAPGLLAALCEAYGIGVELHEDDPVRLQRLAARLVLWFPRRGEVGPALELLSEALGEPPRQVIAHVDGAGPRPVAPPLTEEAFTCRGAAWWARRSDPGARPRYRIGQGVLQFQPRQDQPGFPLVREDVLMSHRPGESVPRDLLRILPVWATLRVVMTTEHP
jgi:hypothetical protein